MSDLRQLIRDILAEEMVALQASRPTDGRMETVSLRTDTDLMRFVEDVLARAQDANFQRDFKAGLHRFALLPARQGHTSECAPTTAPYTLMTSTPVAVPTLTKTLITERDVAALPRDQTRIRIGRTSRLTPLASDELKRRGIKIERTST